MLLEQQLQQQQQIESQLVKIADLQSMVDNIKNLSCPPSNNHLIMKSYNGISNILDSVAQSSTAMREKSQKLLSSSVTYDQVKENLQNTHNV